MDPFASPDTDSRPTFDDDDASGPAFTSAVLGVIAMTLNMVMLCTCYMSILPGGVLGAIAFIMARTALAENPKGAARAYAQMGQATGIIALLYFLVFLMAIMAYVLLYVLLFLGVFIAEVL